VAVTAPTASRRPRSRWSGSRARKEEILEALVSSSLTGLADIAEQAATGLLSPDELIGAVIDLIAISGLLRASIGTDPSAAAALLERSRPYPTEEELTKQIIYALAGADASEAQLVAAQAAFAVARHGTISVLRSRGTSQLSRQQRDTLLASALRALHA
jgi:hypothetical protein